VPFYRDMPTKAVREKVVAFRLTPEQWDQIFKKHGGSPVIGLKSVGDRARKLLLDWSDDKLTWRNKKDRLMASDVATAPTRKALAAASA